MSTFLTQLRFIAARSVKRTLRQPATVMPVVVFPLVLLAVSSNGLKAVVNLPGFPTDSYLNFALTVCFMQAALFAALAAGTELAHDIETGFLDRLSLTPLQRVAILTGQLAGAVALAALGATVYITTGLIFGATFEAGVGGVVVLVVLAMFIALSFGAIGHLMALRSGSGEAVQGLFPLLFVLLFLSSSNLPRDLIEADWFRTIADVNPVSYLVEGLRSLIIGGWDATALLRGFGTAAAVLTVAATASALSLKSRMART